MKEMPSVGFVCTGENALELSGAICCAGRLMRFFNDNGYSTGGCYSCICPSKQIDSLKGRIENLCKCNDVVVTVGCEGFRGSDVIPDVVQEMASRTVPHITTALCSEEYIGSDGVNRVSCFPSRAVSVMYGECLILNLPSDVKTALGRLTPIMGKIGYIVGSASNKCPFQSTNLGELTAEFYCQSSFQE